jgi:hypothetical protein
MYQLSRFGKTLGVATIYVDTASLFSKGYRAS